MIASRAPRPASQFGELDEGEPGVEAGPAAIADERDQLLVGDGERGARVAAGGDIGVELVGAGNEPLRVVRVVERCAVTDEQRAGLQQVAGRAWRQLGARGDADLTVVDVDRSSRPHVGIAHGLGLDPSAADPELAQRRPVWAEEEAADDRVLDA